MHLPRLGKILESCPLLFEDFCLQMVFAASVGWPMQPHEKCDAKGSLARADQPARECVLLLENRRRGIHEINVMRTDADMRCTGLKGPRHVKPAIPVQRFGSIL